MHPRSSPAHAREEPPVLLSEEVIASARWRDRVDAGSGGSGASGVSAGDGAADEASALERVAVLPMRGRIARAVRAPVVAGLAVFVVAVLAAIGISVASSLGAQLPIGGSTGQPELGGGVDGSGAGAGASGTPSAGSAPQGNASATDGAKSANGTGEPLFVHVVGAVERAGVVELEVGARVSDAIEAAGGASDKAVLAGVNLARLVVDGEQLLVPDEEALAAGGAGGAGGAAGTGGSTSAGAAGASAAAAGVAAGAGESLVNLNTADATLLETLPRVGPALAGRIIDWREQNGGFASVDQLLEVTGIGAKTLAGFRDRVTV